MKAKRDKLLSPEEARKLIDKNMSEKDFLAMVIEYAQSQGWLVAHFRPAMTSKGWRTAIQGDPGFPDLAMVRSQKDAKGRKLELIFAELKKQGHPITDAQEEWIAPLMELAQDCVQVGVYVWWPSEWDEIVKILAL